MRLPWVCRPLLACVTMGCLTACTSAPAESENSGSASDCEVDIRFDGRTYRKIGDFDVPARSQALGTSLIPECDDSSYPGEPTDDLEPPLSVKVRKLPRIPVTDAIGVRWSDTHTIVFVATEMFDEKQRVVRSMLNHR